MSNRDRHDDLINRYNRLGDYSAAKSYRDSPMSPSAYRSTGYKDQNSTNIDHQYFEYRPSCSFTMSRQQCQSFLLSIKQSLKRWQKQSSGIKDGIYENIHKRFNEIHERIKRQILDLLNKTFEQHQRRIRQELSKYRSSQSRQFLTIRAHICRVQDQINQLLYGLKGPDYKRSISDTVTKNFTVVLDNLQIKVRNAMLEYQRNIGGVQIDQARIDCIRSDLKRLFRLIRRPIEIEVSGNQKTCGCCQCGTGSSHTGGTGGAGCCCFKPCQVYFGCN